MSAPKKRILIFSTAYFPLVGGAEIAVKEITDRLPEYEFVMITAKIDPSLSTHERMGNVECYRIGRGNRWDKFRLIAHGPRFAETLGAFHTVWSIMASYAGFAALRYKKRHPDVPYLLTLQEGDSRWDIYKHVWWCWPYFKQIFNRADRVQAISSYLARWAKRMGATCPVEIVPNGVTIDYFRLPHVSDGSTVVTVSRLVKKNGVDTLIGALTYLPDTITLTIAGSGEEEVSLKKLAAELLVSNRVQFLGSVSQTEIPELLHRSAVFCRPSRSEGLGIAFLEAMAAGVPVVATSVGGIPDFLKDGETGLVVVVDDPKDIAEKIKKIFGDPLLANKLSRNGRALVEEHYEWGSIAGRMKTLL